MKGDRQNQENRSGMNPRVEKAYLISVQVPPADDVETKESLEELESLALTAGAEVVGKMVQKRSAYDPATLMGRGKLVEARREIEAARADLIVFDNELSGSQQGKLEKEFGVRVIDRRALILDIFAQHARSREGRTQVELAQLSYMLPRIRGKGLELSRLGGGIGTRGPGETQLEVDRRRIRKRMKKLEKELSHMESVRRTQRKKRKRAGLISLTLVGYTNSGKSSLLNRLTRASVLVEDKLFSTLDSTTRKLRLPTGETFVLSDTVGFIRNIPHELIAAFRSTLEIVREADMLIHVVDASKEDTMKDRMKTVHEILSDLGASNIPVIVVLNKVDLLPYEKREFLQKRYPDFLQVSARTGEGIPNLVSKITQSIEEYMPLSIGPRVINQQEL